MTKYDLHWILYRLLVHAQRKRFSIQRAVKIQAVYKHMERLAYE